MMVLRGATQPVEALPLRELPDGPAAASPRHTGDPIQVLLHQVCVQRGV